MGSREKNNTAAGSKMEAVDVEETVGNILTILSQQLLLNFPLNCQRLQDEIGEKVAAGKPIDMLLPAFPCKSINKVRTDNMGSRGSDRGIRIFSSSFLVRKS